MPASTTPASTYDRAWARAAGTGPILVAAAADSGAAALATAERLAARDRRGVVVVSAVEPPTPPLLGLNPVPTWSVDPAPFLDARREQVDRQIATALEGRVDWPVEVVLEEPSRAIAAAARAHRASIIVMGLGRHDAAARILGGEATLRAIRRASVPVLAVGGGPPRLPARVAVVAVDFSASSLGAARAALGLLADGGTLHLVHVRDVTRPIEPPHAGPDVGGVHDQALAERFARFEAALVDPARPIAIIPATVSGHPATALTEFARAHDADLVAAGRQGHGLLERLLVGRVTTALLRGASCAVLVSPEPDATDRVAAERALTGTSESTRPDEWPELLDRFTRRNAGRRTALEVDDPDVGAQAQETGYLLLGAAYDRHDGRVALMLGDATGRAHHLTRMIGQVSAVGVLADRAGGDVALRVAHGDGQTLLTFLPAAR